MHTPNYDYVGGANRSTSLRHYVTEKTFRSLLSCEPPSCDGLVDAHPHGFRGARLRSAVNCSIPAILFFHASTHRIIV